MYLERVEIAGFRGLNRLSLPLDMNTVLVGENAWGKTSLLDALTLSLGIETYQYAFTAEDFHRLPNEPENSKKNLQIILTFTESRPGRHRSYRFRKLAPVWIANGDARKHIYYRISAELDEQQNVKTFRYFLDKEGKQIRLANGQTKAIIAEIVRLYPVLRLQDARFIPNLTTEVIDSHNEPHREAFNNKMSELTKALINNPDNLSDEDLREGLDAMQQLLGHYFADHGTLLFKSHLKHRKVSEPHIRGWHALENINKILAKPNQRNIRLIILGMFSSILQSRGSVELDPYARPIVIVENPETRLHPIMLSVAWGLLNLFSLQRITTTNSGELLSLAPLQSVCRLVRDTDKVAAYRLGDKQLHAEEERRISFHIRYNRPSALFARCWLLVEGETEIWLMNELARQCNYFFESEGIKVIEFAQCGLKPLLKYATYMGIEWHTLVDGDEAGKKYAATVKEFAAKRNDAERDRLTRLPALDMEHYLYKEGFRNVYHEVAGVPDNEKWPVRRVIIKAIQRSSKPDLALTVANNAAQRGIDAIPTLLKVMFSRVAWLARGKAN
ncbi:TPA: DUF2813 domain-containing protein [Proteus mirabilis]|uniref:ATP-dependent nuclease n=1 Tax=Proteus mirabilis TaxID=584 RepID=UPI001A1DB320|nr:ATP-dependent endonuclease [Proteus mirabilis]ELA7786948.1 DUF2813 domain-containing protein [Proteus mirabilis]UPW76572.1 ATP-dependent endonuclease [Proteus mirabilis]UPW80472.1 ATP-dependent endonuclease [Proteus mirabilis]HAU5680905.1 DUF2813 domain-containing protein [Proteus mirabilis]HCZ8285751.1 DUF2813 domain-containing protein [Proteus mirabilis]